MKKFKLLCMTVFIFVGCGNSNNSRPTTDGKGSIDIVDYLPSQHMTKHFTLEHPLLYSVGGEQNITVEKQKIHIEQDAVDNSGHFGHVMQKVDILYDDSNVSNFFHDGQVVRLMPTTVYRHIDLGEELLNKSETTSDTIYHDSENKNIGTSTSEESYECHYKEITDTITDKDNNIIENDGDFLVLECNEQIKESYSINKEYRDLDDRNGQVTVEKMKYLSYYKKGVGHIYEEEIDKETRELRYHYHVYSVEYK